MVHNSFQIDPNLEPYEIFQFTKYVVAGLAFFSLFACFEKCAFLDVLNFFHLDFNRQQFRYFI